MTWTSILLHCPLLYPVYLVSALTIALGFAVVPYLTGHEWLAAVIFCWASPALDTLWNLCKWWFKDTGDFKQIVS